MKRFFAVIAAMVLCLAVSGCATMKYPGCYKVEGKEFKQFKDLDDDKALKLVALIYNVQPRTFEEGVARSLALEDYLGLLAKRRSKYITNSGIFNTKYDKVKLSAWSDADLERLYGVLEPAASVYYTDVAPELSEEQNAKRIIRITALNSVCREIKRRHNSAQAMEVGSQLLMGALSVAMALM